MKKVKGREERILEKRLRSTLVFHCQKGSSLLDLSLLLHGRNKTRSKLMAGLK